MAGEPDLADVIRDAIENRLLDVHTSIPGIVKKYDRVTQTCDVLIAVQRVDYRGRAVVFTEYPIVPHVPVAWPGGGGFATMFPLKAGDSVWLVFSEQATGPHRETGEVSVPGFTGRFNLDGALAVPCPAVVTKKAFADAGDEDEAVIIAPTGGTLRVSKSGASADFVALAGKVNENFARLREAFVSWAPVSGDGGAALKAILAPPPPAQPDEGVTFEDVTSETLKAD